MRAEVTIILKAGSRVLLAATLLMSSLAEGETISAGAAQLHRHGLQHEGECMITAVTFAGPYFEGDPDSGFVVRFASGDGTVTRTPRSVRPPGVARTRLGDRVRVCLLSTPTKTASCNPEVDPRGRYYEVYDFRTHLRYQETNSNHGCGGA